METVSKPPLLKLNLGDIEIEATEALRLRPGVELKCNIPEEFQAHLTFNGESYARANVSLHGSQLTVRITEI